MYNEFKEFAEWFAQGPLGLIYFIAFGLVVMSFIGTVIYTLYSDPNTFRYKDVGHYTNHLIFNRWRLVKLMIALGTLQTVLLIIGAIILGIADS